MLVPRTRTFLFTGLALLAGSLAACSDLNENPVSPDLKKDAANITTYSLVETTWDFAYLLNQGETPDWYRDLGVDETITNGEYGSIYASTEPTSAGAARHVSVKEEAPTVTERGLGLCAPGRTGESDVCDFKADGDEVGDGGPGSLYLDFDGVLPGGSELIWIKLGSVQTGEGYRYSISTDGGTTFGTETDVYNTSGLTDDIATLDVNLPTSGLVIKFEKAPDGASDNDYTVISAKIDYDEPPVPEFDGRMTGGGVKATGTNGEVVTFGLTLHCDIDLSNNLEVNWRGHQWHLDKPILTAICTNEPDIDAPPPPSPIDTFEGTAMGRLDGVWGSFAEFRFQDAGEPGRNDTVEITIYEGGDNTTPVALRVDFQKISVGNWQMHYDQPHGQKP